MSRDEERRYIYIESITNDPVYKVWNVFDDGGWVGTVRHNPNFPDLFDFICRSSGRVDNSSILSQKVINLVKDEIFREVLENDILK